MTIRYDVMLDPITRDLPLAPVLSNGVEKVAQSAVIATSLHEGESILLKSAGMRFIEWGQQKPLQVSEVSDFVRREILRLDGVVRVESWAESFDSDLRKLTIAGRVVVEDGSEFAINVIPSASNSNAVSSFVIAGLPAILGKGII